MAVDFTGAGAYSEIPGGSVNFTGVAAPPTVAGCELLGSMRPRGGMKLVVLKGAKDFSAVRPVASPGITVLVIGASGVTVVLSGRVQPKAAPLLEYPYVAPDGLVAERERVTGAVQ